MKSIITDRIRVTKNGKVLRRAMALGHSRGNKRKIQITRKKKSRDLNIPKRIIAKYN